MVEQEERVPAGTLLLALADGQALFAGGSDQVNTLFVSNAGGVADSFQHTQDVRLALASLDHVKDRLGGLRVRDVKSEVMGQDDWMSQIFLGVSSFAIVAGIMLVLNIYAMLAEERRKEMGVMRALGARRGHLARQYLYEGSVYSLVASVGGLVVGLGLAWLVIEGMNRFTWFSNTDSDLRMVFTVEVQTLIVAGAVGLLVALVTVLVTSLKISGINIVAAMKEQSEPKRLERRRWTMIWPALTAALGLLMTVGAVTGDDGTMYILGPTLAALGIVLMLQRYLPGPVLLSALALAIMAYSQIAFQIPAVKAAGRDESTMFFLTSMVLVLAAIWLVVLNFPAVIWLMRQTLGRLRSTLPIVRIAIAYPADRPTRTGFTMGMFALVIFLTTVVSIFLHLIESQTEAMSRREVGGFDAVVAVNPDNPVPDLPQRLSRSETVDAAAILDTSALRSATIELPQFLQGDYPSEFGHSAPDPKAALMEQAIGLDTVFIRTTRSELDRRSPEYATDRQAWEALSRDPNLVIVDDTYSGSAWQIRHPVVKPGDVLKLRDPATGAVREKTVIGRLTTSELWMRPLSGVLMSSKALEEFVSKDGGPPATYFVRFQAGVDEKAVANSIEKELIDSGVQVNLVSDMLEQSLSWLGFIRIIQGFMAFGLLVGIAGLGVVSARAVYQRKEHIGTLRALGFRRWMVLAYLLVEASFVALLGILLGVAAGTVAGFRMYLSDNLAGSFTVPVMELSGLVALVYVAAMAFTIASALRAASMPPVEALRPRE